MKGAIVLEKVKGIRSQIFFAVAASLVALSTIGPAMAFVPGWGMADPARSVRHITQVGIASEYSGGITASGERADPGKFTAASRSIRLGAVVRVSHGGYSAQVRVNDRGPYVRGRIIDLMPAAARAIHCPGLCEVRVSAEKTQSRMYRIPRCPIGYHRVGHICRIALPRRQHENRH